MVFSAPTTTTGRGGYTGGGETSSEQVAGRNLGRVRKIGFKLGEFIQTHKSQAHAIVAGNSMSWPRLILSPPPAQLLRVSVLPSTSYILAMSCWLVEHQQETLAGGLLLSAVYSKVHNT